MAKRKKTSTLTKKKPVSRKSVTLKPKARTKVVRPASRALKARKEPAAVQPSPAASIGERRRNDPETLRLRAFQPGLTVSDLAASIRFYTDALGFIVGERWTNDHGVLMGVSVKAGACSIGLSQDDWAKGRERQKGQGVRIWCETAQDIDALADRIKRNGGRLTQEPKFQPWGVRMLELDDPDGYHLTIFKNS